MKMVKGSELSLKTQEACKRRYVYRFTIEHVPKWAKKNPRHTTYPHFKDDQDWLEHTTFPIKDDGSLDNRYSYCQSNPTYPNGKPE